MFWSNRKTLALVLLVIAGVAVYAGVTVNGNFNAKVGVKRTALGPINIDVNGQVGDPMVVPKIGTNAGAEEKQPDYPITATPPPYNGPTAEERAALAELRAALKAASMKRAAAMPPEMAGMIPPIPDIRLPARRLTRYELEDIRKSTRDLQAEAKG